MADPYAMQSFPKLVELASSLAPRERAVSILNYWHRFPDGPMPEDQARTELTDYLGLTEGLMAEIIASRSIPFWLLAIRLTPTQQRETRVPMTEGVSLLRLDAAIQKFSALAECKDVGWSDEVSLAAMFMGLFQESATQDTIDDLRRRRRLVLASFGPQELLDVHVLRVLARELQSANAMRRMLNWGERFGVQDGRPMVTASKPFRRAASVYHARLGRFEATSTGTVIPPSATPALGAFFPSYTPTSLEEAGNYMAFAAERLVGERLEFTPPNFTWSPIALNQLYHSHRAFEEPFAARNKCSLLAALFVMCSLSHATVSSWRRDPDQFADDWSNAVTTFDNDRALIRFVLEASAGVPATMLDAPRPSQRELLAAIEFMTLKESTRADIDVAVGAGAFPIVSSGALRLVDHAQMIRFINRLFLDVRPFNQNFKGDALEELTRANHPLALPSTALSGNDGSKKQIDAAYIRSSVLVVAECKAVGLHVSFHRGSPDRELHRLNEVRGAIQEADQKARWLSTRPKGRNYEIPDSVQWICPVGITPFVEFVPPQEDFYWLHSLRVPRVMRPSELAESLQRDDVFVPSCLNLVPLVR